MQLQIPTDLQLPLSTKPYLRQVVLDITEDDGMFQGNTHHYLSCGASALNVILAALRLAGMNEPASILDFGCGAGRVTRWLRAAFPAAAIDACDLRQQDVAFCREKFAARTWVSGIDIDALDAPSKYDLLWLGSVATHLSATNTIQLLNKMLSWTQKGGIVIMSLHGRYALSRQSSGAFRYIHDAGWSEITAGYERAGYGYADYEGQDGYGISVSKPSWMAGQIERCSDARLVLFTETAWDGHHDVAAVQAV